jgi:hypothetical protein
LASERLQFASTLQASGFRSDVTVFRLNALSRRKIGSEPAFRRNTAERVHTIEAAHNPEVAGSNPRNPRVEKPLPGFAGLRECTVNHGTASSVVAPAAGEQA